LGQKTLFLSLKKPVFASKSLETPVLGLKTAISNNSELTKISEFVLFQTFQKLQKNGVKLRLQKLQKTRSSSKTDSNVWFKVRNAGPYLT